MPAIAAGAALTAEAIAVSFDELAALADASREVPMGRINGLIEPNGAGKTTAVNVLSGFQRPTAGSVVMDGVAVTGQKPHDLRRAGLARTFQGGQLFADLSVLDNLEVTAVGLGRTRREAVRLAAAMLDRVGIGHLAERPAGALPYTDERRVAIGRALMRGHLAAHRDRNADSGRARRRNLIFVGNSGIIRFGHVGFMCLGAHAAAWSTIPPMLEQLTLSGLPAVILTNQSLLQNAERGSISRRFGPAPAPVAWHRPLLRGMFWLSKPNKREVTTDATTRGSSGLLAADTARAFSFSGGDGGTARRA